MISIDKEIPGAEWIEWLRGKYPCETEIDDILVKKLMNRPSGSYIPITLEALLEGVKNLIRSRIGNDIEVSNPRWLSGGASKLQMAFRLAESPGSPSPKYTDLVLRMEPAESIVASSRMREYEIIRALDGYIPVPPMFWVDANADFLPYPALIYGLAEGVAKQTSNASEVSGIGTRMTAALSDRLAPQFVRHLARLHRFDWQNADLPSFGVPQLGTEVIVSQLNRWERVWEEDSVEDIPLIRLALSWLRANAPATDHLSMVHADYRVGNFLFDEPTGNITAWLDWETAYIGDRHEDLAFSTKRSFGHMAEDGKTFLVSGIVPIEKFFEDYEVQSGLIVNPRTLQYYDIFCNIRGITILLATGTRISRMGKTHQDVVVNWLSGLSYPLLHELQHQLQEVI